MEPPAEKKRGLKRFFSLLGPGLITGASDDDPSGIGTYSVAGAQFGYSTLWMAVFAFPLMSAVQYVCAKIGLVSGQGIAGTLREVYPRRFVQIIVLALLIANAINAGVDVLAIAAGLNLIVPVPIRWLLLPIGLFILVVQIWGSYHMLAKVFKWLTLSLFAYIAAAVLAKPDWPQVLRGTLVPHIEFDEDFIATIVALLGTTISPYLFFWQASQEVEEEVAIGRKRLWERVGASDEELKYAAWDVNIGMFFSNVVMYFIILATAATLHATGRQEIHTAADAAEALRPVAGNASTILMALGLIGTGLLAVPILTASAGYAVCEAFGWQCSLDAKPGQAKEFYIILTIAMLGGLVVDLIGINPIDALFWTAVINGFLAPPLLIVIMLVANNRKVMGERVNSPLINVLGWTTTALMFAAAIALVYTWL